MSDAVIAAIRFGLGARSNELKRIGDDPTRWLIDQISGPSRLDPGIAHLGDSATVLANVLDLRREQRQAKRMDPDSEAGNGYGRIVRRHYVEQCNARYRAAVATDTPFHERLVHFWTNHFAISVDKQPIPAIAGLFEKEAIRPNVSGKFIDLLMAVEKHPAMIVYLDNQRSIGPGSKTGQRARKRRNSRQVGINENLAREILELHTLGVDGGYSQADVTSFAKVITGWSVGGQDNRGGFSAGTPGRFLFRDEIHEPGSRTILGQRYRQKGIKQGEAVLRDLAAHPSTALYIAEKLARHFVDDDPPESVIDELAAVYLRSDGDLGEVYEALVLSETPWQSAFSKYKSPHDFVISTLRAFDHEPDDRRYITAALDTLGQPPYQPGSPAGWPDTSAHWGGADALYKRIEWSNAVALAVGSRVNPVTLGDRVLDDAFNPETRKAVSRAESLAQGMTLFLASPDFQRR
jgi:uncharacterized protein (DUF1800 family)